MAEQKITLRSDSEVVVRMYGQGFGDCFLLALPRLTQANQPPDLKNPVYIVIDSGLFFSTPGGSERMRQVARSIHQATGGNIDLLVATHEHYDHLSGFEQAKEEWKKIGVQRIWLGWTEDPDHPATQRYDREKMALQDQARLALQVAGLYSAQDPALGAELQRMYALIGFDGDANGAEFAGPLPPPSDVQIKAPDELSKIPDSVLDDFAKQPGARFNPNGPQTARHFLEPGQVWRVPGTAADAYVLGPPTAEGRLAQDFVEGEVYPEEEAEAGAGHIADPQARMALAQSLRVASASARAARASLGTALQRHLNAAQGDEKFVDVNAPFAKAITHSLAQARRNPFFNANYFHDLPDRPSRRIDTEWLHGAGQLALQVDRVINNTSLVLAFRLPATNSQGERVLLFVGDAQVGNWLSWHELQPQDWHRPEGGDVDHRPTATQLLAHTTVYKVGHHGSHNATLQARGLEMMPNGVIAFVPTSRVYPQDQQKVKWEIPLHTLTDALWRKSGGQVVFPHEHQDYNYANTQFAQRVESAKEKFAPMKQKGKVIEAAVPIWRQVRV